MTQLTWLTSSVRHKPTPYKRKGIKKIIEHCEDSPPEYWTQSSSGNGATFEEIFLFHLIFMVIKLVIETWEDGVMVSHVWLTEVRKRTLNTLQFSHDSSDLTSWQKENQGKRSQPKHFVLSGLLFTKQKKSRTSVMF